ncbi:MAG: aminoglycoside phosphotransferase [Mycobacterium sp.]|nr:aminoglycoside phosphotransferase [Mycobacterium sp.]
MTFPAEQPAVPDAVSEIAAGRAVRAVWLNELGGTTFALDNGSEYVKVYPAAEAHQLVAEQIRLAWNYPSGGQTRSERWMYSVEEAELFEADGVEPDRERIAYYRLRWEE